MELQGAIRSLRRRATDPDSLEIMVAADPDDEETIQVAKDMNVVLHITPERYGYPGLHTYYNELAMKSSGDWILVFNDDTRMCTAGWDKIIEACKPAILHPHCDYIPDHNSFPILPGDWIRKLGHISIGKGTDLWWQAIGIMLPEAVQKITINIHHLRGTTDPTSLERDARDVQSELDEFNSDEGQLGRCYDMCEVIGWMGLKAKTPDKIKQVHFNLV